MPSDLRESLTSTLNRASAENGSNTPDFVLAQYMLRCLEAFDEAVNAREQFYGRPSELPRPGRVSMDSCMAT